MRRGMHAKVLKGIDVWGFCGCHQFFTGAAKLELLASNNETTVYRDLPRAFKVGAAIDAVKQQYGRSDRCAGIALLQ